MRDHRTEDAMSLLAESRQARISDVRSAVAETRAVHERLVELLEEDDALHRAMHVLDNSPYQPPDAGRPAGHLSRTIVGRAQRILRDLEILERVIGEASFGRPRSLVDDGAASKREAELVRVALNLRDDHGRVKARELAMRLRELNPDRYSSSRSAYGAVYDQLNRSQAFERAGPGEFTIKALSEPFRSGKAESDAGDLPFE